MALDLFAEEDLEVVEVPLVSEMRFECGRVGHGLDFVLIDRELRALVVRIVVVGFLDLWDGGAKGEDGEQVVRYVIVEAGGIEVHMVVIMVFLKEFRGSRARVRRDTWDVKHARRVR